MGQTTRSQKGEPRVRAMPAGVRKMPTPITSPTTSAVREARPSWRRNGIPSPDIQLSFLTECPILIPKQLDAKGPASERLAGRIKSTVHGETDHTALLAPPLTHLHHISPR